MYSILRRERSLRRFSACGSRSRIRRSPLSSIWPGLNSTSCQGSLRSSRSSRPSYEAQNSRDWGHCLTPGVVEVKPETSRKPFGDMVNVTDVSWRRLLACGRISARGSRSILQGFLKVGSNFLSLGTPLPEHLREELRKALKGQAIQQIISGRAAAISECGIAVFS